MTLIVATPVGGADIWASSVSCGYSENLRALSHEMAIEQVVEFADDVVRARNRLVGRVLAAFPNMTHVLWWDADQWPEDRRIVKSMIDTGCDLIGAPYTNKRPPIRWVHQLLNPMPQSEGAVQEVRAIGFGFTITSRQCLLEVAAHSQAYTDHPNDTVLSNCFGQMFDDPRQSALMHERMLLSEDFSFCKRWRQLGRRVNLYLKGGAIMHAGSRGWSGHDVQGMLT
jgi:hypothetical protein